MTQRDGTFVQYKPYFETDGVLLRTDADERDEVRYSPAKNLLHVSVVGNIVFLAHVSAEETGDSMTYTDKGESMAVNLRALLYALISQAPIEISQGLTAAPLGGFNGNG